MSYIRAIAKDLDGNEVSVRYEAPKDEAGRSAIGFLKPSGKTYVNPMYAFGKQVGLPDDAHRPAHLGMDGQGNEGVSDQRWIYDTAEAARLEKEQPDRYLRVEG